MTRDAPAEVDQLFISTMTRNALRRSSIRTIALLESIIISSPDWRFGIRNLGAIGSNEILRAIVIFRANQRKQEAK